MINLENINDQTIEQILNEAKEKIDYFNPEWTYRGESDPGITILELLVWFIYLQREYISRVSPIIGIKLLKFLGIKFKKNLGSKTFIEVSNFNADTPYINVPKGTKFLADNMIFENNEQKYITNSQILSIKFINCEFTSEKQYYEFDGSKQFYIFGENIEKLRKNKNSSEFYINFDKKILHDKEINIYFEIYLENNLKRNKINEDDYFEDIAKTTWEYYGVKNSVTGWHKINVKDLTYNFLFTGIVSFKINGHMEPLEDSGYYTIRVLLNECDYDFSPQVTKIIPNVFEIEQKDTQCEKIIIKKNKILKKDKNYIEIILRTHLCLYGEVMLYVKNKFGKWENKENFKIIKDIKKGKIKIIINELDYINDLKDDEECLMFIAYSNEIKSKIIIGDGQGSSGQMFEMNFSGVPLFKSFELMVGEEHNSKVFFDIWHRIDDFFSSDKYDKKFIFEENINKIIFGDNIYGMAPKSCKNSIRISNLAFTLQDLSNIKKGLINKVITENPILYNAKIKQLNDAKGGIQNESFENARYRGLKIFSEKKRAITIKDYEKIIKQTPGLIFENVTIIPGFSECVNNYKLILIAVKCKNLFKLPQSYKNIIMNKIEKYRLLNTCIKIIDPEYIYISVYSKIYVNSKFKSNKNIFEKEINLFFKNLNKKMGQILNSVDLFSLFEKYEFVKYVDYLKILPDSFHTSLTNESGNIVAPCNGIYILKNLDIDCIMAPEI